MGGEKKKSGKSKTDRVSLFACDARRFYELVFRDLDLTGEVDLKDVFRNFKDGYNGKGMPQMAALREEWEKRLKMVGSSKSLGYDNLRTWAEKQGYVGPAGRSDSSGTSEDETKDGIFNGHQFVFLNSRENDGTIAVANSIRDLVEENGGTVIRKSQIGSFDKSGVHVIGFGNDCKKMRKFLESHLVDIWTSSMINASLESGKFCHDTRHILIDYERWYKENQTPSEIAEDEPFLKKQRLEKSADAETMTERLLQTDAHATMTEECSNTDADEITDMCSEMRQLQKTDTHSQTDSMAPSHYIGVYEQWLHESGMKELIVDPAFFQALGPALNDGVVLCEDKFYAIWVWCRVVQTFQSAPPKFEEVIKEMLKDPRVKKTHLRPSRVQRYLYSSGTEIEAFFKHFGSYFAGQHETLKAACDQFKSKMKSAASEPKNAVPTSK